MLSFVFIYFLRLLLVMTWEFFLGLLYIYCVMWKIKEHKVLIRELNIRNRYIKVCYLKLYKCTHSDNQLTIILIFCTSTYFMNIFIFNQKKMNVFQNKKRYLCYVYHILLWGGQFYNTFYIVGQMNKLGIKKTTKMSS